MRVAVIGSGPAGFACARALIRRGCIPTVLDAGETLPSERQTVIERMAAVTPADWSAQDRDLITENPYIASGRLKKMVFGSDFYFARDRACSPEDTSESLPCATFARGGFTMAWGAAVMPAEDSDLDEWPLKRADLSSSYRQVLKDMPLSAAEDDLLAAFPLFKDNVSPLPLPDYARTFLSDLRSSMSSQGASPFLSGQARLAVDATACRHCGLCLSGCVYDAIYTTAKGIIDLQRQRVLQYVPGLILRKLEEKPDGVRLEMLRTETGSIERQEFDIVFLAAGVLQSTRIVLASLGLFDQPVIMKDSQKFAIPLLRMQRTPLAWPNAPSLASLFIDFKVSDISNHWIHAQISGVNDFVFRRLKIPPWKTGFLRSIAAPFYERLLIAWCGLHSDHSSVVELRLADRTRYGLPILELRAKENPEAAVVARKAARRLALIGRRARTWVVRSGMTLATTGAGHFGGTLPMRSQPRARLDTDILGRISGWHRVHVIDGSILPSIPATTLALVQMANADRIATTVELNS
jgi:ferredoxin